MNTLVLEETPNGLAPVDVYQRLSDDRMLFITDEISEQLAVDITATLLLKDMESSEEKITLFINSSGGPIRNIFMVLDAMRMIDSPISTICMGAAMDEAALILACGTPGMRFATKISVISVSQLIQDWIMPTNITDGKNLLDQLVVDNNQLLAFLSKATKKKVAVLRKELERKKFLNPIQAVKYGIIDKVIGGKK